MLLDGVVTFNRETDPVGEAFCGEDPFMDVPVPS